MSVCVVTDSVASIPESRLTPDIEVVDLYVNDGERNEADRAIDLDDFYRRLADMKHLPTSSQPSVEALVNAFKRGVERGYDVVGVFISEKMSGTCETARLAAQMVLDQFPGARIEVVDSKTNSMQEGFAALAAARAAEAGQTVERCAQAAAETIRRTKYLFTPHNLDYLVRGGRIGTASALLGQLLQIRPILCVRDGVTTPFSKVRTQSRALSEMARVFAEDVRERGLRDVVVHYISDRATAEKFAREVIDPIAGFAVEVVPVSPVVGLHVGPAVAIAYETEREVCW
jgi:DegV family protein with EDD domain